MVLESGVMAIADPDNVVHWNLFGNIWRCRLEKP